MKRWFTGLWVAALTAVCAVSPAAGQDLAESSAYRALYVVETDDASASESLNRITGDYDRGFSTSDQSYDSPHHQSSDRFSTQGPSFEY